MRVDVTVSHGDWFNSWGSWGRPSVERILDQLKEAGVQRVPWRTMFGARAQYHSKIETVYWGREGGGGIDRPGNEGTARRSYDLRQWDPLPDAIEAGRERGLEIGAWYPLFEETHFQLDVSRLAREKPECWVETREGRTRRSKLSFAHPATRAHKLGMLTEQLDYNPDYVMLDFYRETQEWEFRRQPSVEVDPSGVSIYGYEPPMRDAFRALHGKDPRELRNDDPVWVDFRVAQNTEFMREAAALVHGRGKRLAVRVRSLRSMALPMPWWVSERYPTDSRRGSFVDWAEWARQGIVDDVVLFMDNWDLFDITAADVWREALDARERMDGKGTLTIGLFMFDMHARSALDACSQLESLADGAQRGGAEGVCLLESNNVHAWGGGIGGGGRKDIGLWSAVHRITRPEWAGLHI
ncbi:hypothetical protein [Bradyrhizobium sp.]|uniref:hypothetical protein n=1 Tax=Bradyrhizobium sp. TaxID=376 RepID=UPI0039E6C300